MILKIIRVLLYIVAGFFIYLITLISFFNKPPVTLMTKFFMMGGFSIPFIVLIVIATALNRFKKWKSAVAVTIFAGTGFTLFCILTFVSYSLSSEARKYFNESFDVFNDYFMGIGTVLILSGLGILLTILDKRKTLD